MMAIRVPCMFMAVLSFSLPHWPRVHRVRMAPAQSGFLAYALLANNHVVALSQTDRRTTADQALGTTIQRTSPGLREQFYGHYLGLSPDSKTLYALALDVPGGSHHLVVLDARTLRVKARYALEADFTYRSIAVGPLSGHLYLAGSRVGKKSLGTIVTVLDSRSGRTIARWLPRHTGTADWWTYRVLLSPDERRLYIDYWRGGGFGLDALKVSSGKLICRRRIGPYFGCLSSYGGDADVYGKHLLVGSSKPHMLVELNRDGRIVRTVNTGLGGDAHEGEFAVDARTDRLYQVGSCSYTGGMSVVDLRTGRSHVLDPLGVPGPNRPSKPDNTVCGERVAVGSNSLVVIGKSIQVVPESTVAGEVLLLDGMNGRVLTRWKTVAGPADVYGAR